jgi:hypothetical protein
MKLDINPRCNGACPLCARLPDCRIRRLLSSSLASLPDNAAAGEAGSGMEIAIFACPSFVEKGNQ